VGEEEKVDDAEAAAKVKPKAKLKPSDDDEIQSGMDVSKSAGGWVGGWERARES